MSGLRRAAFLDRDGTLIEDAHYLADAAAMRLVPGAADAVTRLNQVDVLAIVVTNQSGIARGYYDLATLDAMHARLRELVAEQGGELGIIQYCPHGPDDGCDCRKPRPGMLKRIALHYGVELAGIWFVGDSSGDLEAALAVDCQPVLVKTGKGGRTLAKTLPAGTLVFDDLAAVAAHLLQ